MQMSLVYKVCHNNNYRANYKNIFSHIKKKSIKKEKIYIWKMKKHYIYK